MRIGGRHAPGLIGRADALEEKALRGLAWRHDRAALAVGKDGLFQIESQPGHARAGIRAVALKTIVRKQRTNLALEVDGLCGSYAGGEQKQAREACSRHLCYCNNTLSMTGFPGYRLLVFPAIAARGLSA